MCLCQTEISAGILLEEMIKPNNLVFLWPREWYQCRKPPAGCLFVSGFHKALHIMDLGVVLSYFHLKLWEWKGTGWDKWAWLHFPIACISIYIPVSHLLYLETCCLLLLFLGDQWRVQWPWHSLGNVMSVQMGFSKHHFNHFCCCFK